jgi:hypothetical protein
MVTLTFCVGNFSNFSVKTGCYLYVFYTIQAFQTAFVGIPAFRAQKNPPKRVGLWRVRVRLAAAPADV